MDDIQYHINNINKNAEELERDLKTLKDKYDINKFMKIEEFNKIFEIQYKPSDLIISMMTLSISLDVEFNVVNISNYINLSLSSILHVKCGKIFRTLLKKESNDKKVFKNHQVTLLIYSKKSKVSLKLFQNGTIHIAGCKTIDMMINVFEKLFKELKTPRYDIVYKNGKKHFEKIKYVSDMSKLKIENLEKFKIDMINCNYNIGFSINRTKLFYTLRDLNVDCVYDPSNHAAVIISHDNGSSILIFEKGSIVITGGKNCKNIKEAYDITNVFLLTHYHKIVKNDKIIDEILSCYQ